MRDEIERVTKMKAEQLRGFGMPCRFDVEQDWSSFIPPKGWDGVDDSMVPVWVRIYVFNLQSGRKANIARVFNPVVPYTSAEIERRLHGMFIDLFDFILSGKAR